MSPTEREQAVAALADEAAPRDERGEVLARLAELPLAEQALLPAAVRLGIGLLQRGDAVSLGRPTISAVCTMTNPDGTPVASER